MKTWDSGLFSRQSLDGRPCRAHAIRRSDPPLCSAHAGRNVGAGAPEGNQNAKTHGFYAKTFTDEELATLESYQPAVSLLDELTLSRVALYRLMYYLRHHATDAERQELMGLIFTGRNTIARLLRTERVLTGQPADGIASAIRTHT